MGSPSNLYVIQKMSFGNFLKLLLWPKNNFMTNPFNGKIISLAFWFLKKEMFSWNIWWQNKYTESVSFVVDQRSSKCWTFCSNVYLFYRSYRDGTGKNRGFLEAVGPTCPFVLLFITATMWAAFSPTDILQREPRLFCLVMGLVLSNAVVSKTMGMGS